MCRAQEHWGSISILPGLPLGTLSLTPAKRDTTFSQDKKRTLCHSFMPKHIVSSRMFPAAGLLGDPSLVSGKCWPGKTQCLALVHCDRNGGVG